MWLAISSKRLFKVFLSSIPLILPTNDKKSDTIMSEYDGAPSGRYPISCFACNGCDFRSILLISILPLSGSKKPVNIFIVVDFPAPFGPKNPTTSPRFTAKSILSTATKFPNDFFRLFASISFVDKTLYPY